MVRMSNVGRGERMIGDSGSVAAGLYRGYVEKSQGYEGEVGERPEKHWKGSEQRHHGQTPLFVTLSQWSP